MCECHRQGRRCTEGRCSILGASQRASEERAQCLPPGVCAERLRKRGVTLGAVTEPVSASFRPPVTPGLPQPGHLLVAEYLLRVLGHRLGFPPPALPGHQRSHASAGMAVRLPAGHVVSAVPRVQAVWVRPSLPNQSRSHRPRTSCGSDFAQGGGLLVERWVFLR